ncbi:GyrI-like domain-containing protein [Olleya sp. HaHaR_3_96]|uniref:GyrI-like domain-containing protein n=1 Tax=Olleya sp. HaHaR_3_96 TaxID=2745560 RepID=UPI001C4F0A17|nr:GyrI-like domain-containing protein [Olleya sp. HaHaR_3_96]QXP60154.1 GyrI-like domain-containing protein [Olleya sp. HaHaR_3_96]
MTPRIIQSKSILIVGLKDVLTFMTNGQGTGALARRFMPKRHQILNQVSDQKFSIQIYDQFDYNKISPKTEYIKWVGVEVSGFLNVPEGLETLKMESGKYAVFNYKGKPEGFLSAWQFIHENWLPSSGFTLDDRPHFEKLPEDYHPTNLEVEEEIWVPIV